jgi:ATP-dependent protease ClpP protease subunit
MITTPLTGVPLPPKPTNATLVYVGQIQNPGIKNLRTACCGAVSQGIKDLQILFASSGGNVDEGLALYTFLRSLPVELTIHSIGNVDSVALIVFLAGKNRFCSQTSTFWFHDFSWGFGAPINQSRAQWVELGGLLTRMKFQSQEILKLRTAFTEEDFKLLQLYDKSEFQNASFAKEKGIVHEIKDVVIPAGGILMNIEV